MDRASDRALAAAQVNGLVMSVVSDSRGIYMSANTKAADPFAESVMKGLKDIRVAMEGWTTVIEPADREKYASAADKVDEFIRFRTELVRLAREVSPAEARVFGDNDAMVTRLQKELTDFRKSTTTILVAPSFVGIALGTVLAVWIRRRRFSRFTASTRMERFGFGSDCDGQRA